jgi:mercuric ion transport protein
MSPMMDNQIGDTTKNGLLAAGGILGAVGASSCCLLPLVFALTGISGAWIGSLTRLAPYQPIFLGIAGLSIGSGLWRLYRKPRQACDGPQCATIASRRATKAVLWLSTVLVVVAATTQWWVQLLA